MVLENSEIRVEYRPFFDNFDQFAIRNLIFKSEGFQDQICCGNRYADADAYRGPLASATVTEQTADHITVRFVWNDRNDNPNNPIVADHSIHANGRFVKIDYVNVENGLDHVDIGTPGGTSAGVHVAHGGDSWIRGYVTHDYAPTSGGYYNRYPGDGVFDPADGGALAYNGHFVVAVYNPANGVGFGRVTPVSATEIVKLLLSESQRNGLELFPYPFFRSHPPFTGHLYVFSGGEADALASGRSLADGEVGGVSACGEEVDVTAAPYTGWSFDGWAGALAGAPNPTTFVLTGDDQATALFSPLAAIRFGDFELTAPGDDPAGWLDTGADSALTEDPGLFSVFEEGGNRFFGTLSEEANIHSHLVVPGSDSLADYRLSGRLRMEDAGGGIGVTALSQYPAADAYYRLRRYGSNDFHLAAHGTMMTGGTVASDVVPFPDVWYRFLLEVEDTGTRTEVRARVWPDGAPEPPAWQIDAWDDSPTRLTAGTVGVWGFGTGAKDFDELAVRTLGGPAPACSDGIDNDLDGRIDFVGNDPGCESATDASERDETGTFACDDGIDDDGDGLVDYVADQDGDGISDPPGDPACRDPEGGPRPPAARTASTTMATAAWTSTAGSRSSGRAGVGAVLPGSATWTPMASPIPTRNAGLRGGVPRGSRPAASAPSSRSWRRSCWAPTDVAGGPAAARRRRHAGTKNGLGPGRRARAQSRPCAAPS